MQKKVSEPKGARSVGVGILGAYGQLAVPLSIADLPVILYVYPFYAGDIRIDVATVGLILMLSRLGDAIVDPFIGRVSDRTSWSFGRRKSWVVLGTPLLMLGTVMTFMPPVGAGPLHLLVWITVFYLGWTMVTIPYGAWGAELSTDYAERSRVTASRMLFTFIGILAVVVIQAASPGGVGTPEGLSPLMQRLAIAIVILMPISVAIIAFFVREPIVHRGAKIGWLEGFRIAGANGPFMRMLAATVVGRVGVAINQVVVLWFFAFALGLGKAGGLPLLVYLVTAVLGAPVWIWLGDRWTKHRALAFATVTSVAIFMTLFLVPNGDLALACFIMAVAGIAASAAGTLGLSMAADTIDLDYLRSGENRAGLLLSFWAFGQKFADAIGAGIAGVVLGFYGFNPNIANTPEALLGVKIVYIIVPGLLFFASVPFYLNFPITPEKQKRIRTVLDHRAKKHAKRTT